MTVHQGTGDPAAGGRHRRGVNPLKPDEIVANATPLAPRPRVAVVLPTYNERDNLEAAIAAVAAALGAVAWEVIVVDDDSPDGTAQLAAELGELDPRIRCIHRIGRRGLAGACLEGMLAAAAPVVAVMDADLQHDPALLPRMLDLIEGGSVDLVVGSRFAGGGDASGGLGEMRQRASDIANMLARFAARVRLSDPMSGYFMLERHTVERYAHRISPYGFKILFDLVASARGRLRVQELPFRFRERTRGESKLDTRVGLEFLALIVSKLTGGRLSVRFILFSAVGVSGIAVHLAVLWAVLAAGAPFAAAQVTATAVAMTSNFFLNNWLTFRERALRGLDAIKGLLSFALVCSLGALANVGVASLIYGAGEVWWLAGVAGAMVGAVWNYAVSAVVTWRAAP